MPKENKKPSVIYISGAGRSGSTILELILNNFDEVWTMGEVQFALQEWVGFKKKDRRGCGCGRELKKCDIWNEVLSNAIPKNPESKKKSIHPLRSRTHIINLLLGNIPIKPETSKFCEINKEVFDQMRERAARERKCEIKYLVDSSKGTRRLSQLTTCEDIDLYVIHLIRDPRAYVDSLTKKRKSTIDKLKPTPRQSLKYLTTHKIIDKITSQIPEEKAMEIKYEDMASNPAKTTKELADWLGLSYKEDIINNFRKRENRGFLGNNARWRADQIYLNEDWKERFPKVCKKVTKLITKNWAKKHGYF